MIITIEDKSFDTKQITQLYPAVVVKTGYGEETTQMSLEWLEQEGEGKVEVVGFALFVHLGEERHRFLYACREQMDAVIGGIARRLQGK